MNTGGKGSLREGRIAQVTAAPALHWVITVHLKHGGTQIQTSRPNLLVDIAKKNPFNFLCGSGWFARIEMRGVREEFVGSYLYQVHLYRCLKSNDYGRLLSGNNAHIKVKRLVCRFAHRFGQLRS
jgi:hypothetical protein